MWRNTRRGFLGGAPTSVYLRNVGVEGYALAIVVALLLCMVVPALLRRREILAETRIDERYAEGLRMLNLAESAPADRESEERGSIFFRTVEVTMKQAEHSRATSANEFRRYAREQARRRARLSRRAANRKMWYVGAGACGVLAGAAWVVAALTSLAIAVPLVASFVFGFYLLGLSYVTGAMNRADEADRVALAEAETYLAGTRGARATSPSRTTHDSLTSRVRGVPSSPSLPSRSAHMVAEHEARGQVRGDKADDVPDFPLEAVQHGDQVREPLLRDAHEDDSSEAIAIVEHARIRERMFVTQVSTASTEERRVAKAYVTEDEIKASTPSYTLKPAAFARRTVRPYAAPAEATAAVPYRPASVGERFAEGAPATSRNEGIGAAEALEKALNRRRA